MKTKNKNQERIRFYSFFWINLICTIISFGTATYLGIRSISGNFKPEIVVPFALLGVIFFNFMLRSIKGEAK